MGKKDETINVANRAWNVLRLALISARKGGVLRRRLVTDLRLVPKFIKSLRPATPSSHHQKIGNFYGERQFSFEKTPLFDFKMRHHRPAASLRFIFPCIAPRCPADSFDFDDCDYLHEECTVDDVVEEEEEEFEEQSGEGSSFDSSSEDDYEEEESEGVDLRADKFIAQFYQQMKLQRQISYLEYHK